jgi:hypothetical protein
MNSIAHLVKSSDWGVLGSKINEITVLEKILRLAGPNCIWCIDQNGHKLANALLKKERDNRTKAVDGFEENMTAYNMVSLMAEKNSDRLNPSLPTTVRGDCGVLIAMAHAAYGHCVLACSLPKYPCQLGVSMTDDTYNAHDIEKDFHPFSRDWFSHVMVFQNTLIYLRDVGDVTNINHVIDKQPILEWNNSSGLLCLSPSYTLTDTFNINAISWSMQPLIDDEDTETMIVQTICKVHNLYENITHFNWKFESRVFYTSLANLLTPDNMGIVLDEASIHDLMSSGLIPHSAHGMCNDILHYSLTENQSESSVQIRKLWKDWPLFCLINDEVENTTYLFRTPYFPEILWWRHQITVVGGMLKYATL